MNIDVFISHSSKDKAASDATCAALESAGIRCWTAPRDVQPGMEYGAAIIEAIDSCRVMVLVFSSNANASTQIHREIERAASKNVTIVPMRIEEIAPTASMEYFLGQIHWLDAITPPLTAHFEKLTETVKAILQVRAGNRPPATGAVAALPTRMYLSLTKRKWTITIGLVGAVLLGAGAASLVGISTNWTGAEQRQVRAWLTIKSVTGFGDFRGEQIRVTATINGNTYVYPTLAGVDWLEIGPDMAAQTFQIPVSTSYTVRFAAQLRSGRELVSVEEQHVAGKTDGVKAFAVHQLNNMTRAAPIAAEISYAITLDH